jgi:hypothetical protein
VVKLLVGVALTPVEHEVFRRFTGRSVAFSGAVREALLIVGRRGGKTRVSAFMAFVLAAIVKHDLAPGERGVVMVIAADRRQARVAFGYVLAFFQSDPALAALIVRQTMDSLDLEGGVSIEVHTGSFRTVRGYTALGVICDEICFWRDDTSANPDTAILAALRPAMLTARNPLLLMISSPHARRGEAWRIYQKNYGRDDSAILVWQADTASMNSLVDEKIIADAYDADPDAAAAEYGAQWRRDIEAFVSREVLEMLVVSGRYELPPLDGVKYVGFLDPSGGSQDSMTLAIAHRERRDAQDIAVLDLLREVRPPFSPEATAFDFCDTLQRYRIHSVVGDHYGGEWPKEQFRKAGVSYERSTRPKSAIYKEALPLFNSGRVELLDHRKFTEQSVGLERRVARGGYESIDHAPMGHDDVANAGCGALVAAMAKSAGPLVW